MPSTERKLLEEIEQMASVRHAWEGLWTQASELVLPSRPILPNDTYPTQPQGLPRTRVFDATAILANEMFAAQLAAQLVNPQIRWFALRAPGERLQRSRTVRLWLEAVEGILRELFSNPRFPTAVHEMALEIGAFGTGTFFVTELRGEIVFMALPLAEVSLRQDERSRVDAVARRVSLSMRQAQAAIPGGLPEALMRQAQAQPNGRVTLIHYVFRRPNGRVGAPASQKPWASVVIVGDTIVNTSGFDDFPYMAPRWMRAPDELYGRGPGTTGLPTVRMLQRVKEVTIRAAQKVVDPPLLVPDDGLVGPVRTGAGAMTTFRAGARKDDLPRALITGARPDFGELFADQLRAEVMRSFFLDPTTLSAPEPRVTATAILDSRDMRFQRMTPMIERLQAEFLVPLIDRVFNLLQRAGRLPPPPPELTGVDLPVAFVSPAALAQLVTEADNMTRFLSRVAPLGDLALASLDSDAFVRKMAQNLSVPEEVLLDQRTVVQNLQQRAQAASVEQFAVGAGGGRDVTAALRDVAAIRAGEP